MQRCLALTVNTVCVVGADVKSDKSEHPLVMQVSQQSLREAVGGNAYLSISG